MEWVALPDWELLHWGKGLFGRGEVFEHENWELSVHT